MGGDVDETPSLGAGRQPRSVDDFDAARHRAEELVGAVDFVGDQHRTVGRRVNDAAAQLGDDGRVRCWIDDGEHDGRLGGGSGGGGC